MKAVGPRKEEQSARNRSKFLLSDNRGQALAETGIAITFLLVLTIGIIEVARGFLVVNMITHAARDGARAAAVASRDSRSPQGLIQDTSRFEEIVRDEIRQVLPGTDGNVDVAVTQPTISGIRMVQVRVTGGFDAVIWPQRFRVDRVITFRDEGRR